MSTESSAARDAATEAAQHVVDEVTSYQYSADKETIDSELDVGLAQAGVQVEAAEKERLVEQIDDLKDDEDGGTPKVTDASPQG